jgi:hypothetical protein
MRSAMTRETPAPDASAQELGVFEIIREIRQRSVDKVLTHAD